MIEYREFLCAQNGCGLVVWIRPELETENSVLKAEKATLQREISGLQQRIEDIELMYQTLQRRAAGSGAGTVHVAMTTASLYTGLSVVVLLTTLGCQR
ncbi:Hypp4936 [Branchiostoma lanceolatum]|uniref:Hypp4936 protein n=1 Tax=Branchiostoma lanceolatum TaxID=7740 RepID=A0A8K0ABB1_BRALA|nr:Hypp4936 [Branchiostoma lanceolatum]